MKKMDIVELTTAISCNLKPGILIENLSVKDKINVYKQIFEEEIEVKQFFIQIEFFNLSSHEKDYVIIGEENEEVYGEEKAKMFPTATQAQLWIDTSTEAKTWLPCTFHIKESKYTIK